MLCKEYCLCKWVGQSIGIVPLFCRTWDCAECAPRRKAALVGLGIRGAPTIFLTLTVNPNVNESPEARAVRLAKAFKEIRRRALDENKRDPKRKPKPNGPDLDAKRSGEINGVVPRQVRLTNGTLPFLCVFERTQRGEPHLHVMVRAEWIGQEWLSKQMAQYMGAPIVHVERIKDRGRVASYVSKYMAKDPYRFRGTKRYWRSPDWKLASDRTQDDPFFSKGGWERMNESFEQAVAGMLGMAMRQLEVRGGVTILTKEAPA